MLEMEAGSQSSGCTADRSFLEVPSVPRHSALSGKEIPEQYA
jgi:hypothetical protein